MANERQPMSQKTARNVQRGLVGGSVLAAAIALIQPWEGLRRDPYRDIIGVPTVCYGETRVEMRRYTADECTDMLRHTLETKEAEAVLKAVPAIKDHSGPYAASISLTYNIGGKAFAHSSIARRFNAGDWKGGCDGFLAWDMAGGKIVQGLKNRREAERKVCLS